MYVYVCLPSCSEDESEKIMKELFDEMANCMAKEIKAMMNSLFDFEKIMAKDKEVKC